MAGLRGKCPHCEGNVYLDEGVRKCLQCSREIRSYKAIHIFYEHNRQAILDTSDQVGRRQTRKMWAIPGGTLGELLKRWGEEKEQTPQPAPGAPIDNHLPRLPEFSNDWSPEVQLKWLEVWGQRR